MSFIWEWISGYLHNFFGFNKSGNILFLGLDFAGKTTLLGLLKDGRFHQSAPTHYAHSEELTFGGLKLTAFDLGGHKQARRVWRKYMFTADGLVFVLDTSDRERFAEANVELQGLISSEETAECPLLILANKIDRNGAASEHEVMHHFNLHGQLTGKGKVSRDRLMSRPMELFMISLTRNQGYGDAFRWLNQYL